MYKWYSGFICLWWFHDFLLDLEKKSEGIIRLKCLRCGCTTPGWTIDALAERHIKVYDMTERIPRV